MPKIAIITYSRAYNYGSALQTYALNKFLRDNGYDATTIDYTTESQQNLYRTFEPFRGLLSIARNLQSLIQYSALKKHLARFDTFIKEKVPMTNKICDQESMDKLSDDYDFFICGSDQIWNAQCDDFDDNYMLSFVRDKKKKCVAYSPSLGAGGKSKSTTDALKKYTIYFRALSCREAAGAEIIADLTGRTVETTADPVLLLSEEEWNEIACKRVWDGDYILGYFIGDRPGMRDFAHRMSKSTRLPVVVIYKNLRDISYGFKTRYDCGPVEFVSLVKHAKAVVTNSFHAVAFSLIFKKDFWVFTGIGSSDSRITGILSLVGLEDRIIDSRAELVEDFFSSINFCQMNRSAMNAYIERSKSFLLTNLTDDGKTV